MSDSHDREDKRELYRLIRELTASVSEIKSELRAVSAVLPGRKEELDNVVRKVEALGENLVTLRQDVQKLVVQKNTVAAVVAALVALFFQGMAWIKDFLAR